MDKNELAEWLKGEIKMQAHYTASPSGGDFYVGGYLYLEKLAEQIIKLSKDGRLR